MSEDQYQQEFECSFEAAIKGAFCAEEMRTMLAEGRICPIEINKDVKTHTAWDLGVSDSTAIWFIQCVGRETAWSITTKPQASASITMFKCCTTSASSMAGNTETTIFRTTSSIAN
jgi:phage terminase large subunit